MMLEQRLEKVESGKSILTITNNFMRWWKVTGPCQHPLKSRGEGEHSATMNEVFNHG